MQAIILAAGEGVRVRPLTRSRPKAMIPVANRPIIEYVIDALTKKRDTGYRCRGRVSQGAGNAVPERTWVAN